MNTCRPKRPCLHASHSALRGLATDTLNSHVAKQNAALAGGPLRAPSRSQSRGAQRVTKRTCHLAPWQRLEDRSACRTQEAL